MTAQAGKDMLLKIEGAPGVFTTVAGLRARTISLNAKTVDATDGDSAGRWRELLAGAGVKSVALSARPALPNTLSTSGTVLISRSVCWSRLDARAAEMPGSAEGM